MPGYANCAIRLLMKQQRSYRGNEVERNTIHANSKGQNRKYDTQRPNRTTLTATMLYPSIWGMDDEFLDGSESAELDDYEAKEIFGDDAGTEITAVDDLAEDENIDEEEPFDDDEFDEFDEFDEANEAEDIAACYAVVMGIAFPDRIPEIFDSVEGTEQKNAKRDPKL